MPKYPNTITWKEAEFVAKKIGFTFRDQSGSHRQYTKEGLGNLTIPSYREISTKSDIPFGFMLRQMNLTKEEFFECLINK